MALTCPPQWGTPRRWDRPTFGELAAKSAKRLGWDLMPWQRYAYDVALEHDGNGNLFYQTVVIKVVRQSGKTTIVLGYVVFRVQMWPAQNLVYTAQDLNHARKKLFREYVPRIERVKGFREDRDFKIRRVNGDESVLFPRTDGYFGISATGEKSGHGGTIHAHMGDEAFALEDPRADQSFLPAMATVVNPQQWVSSAAGTYKSLWFNEKVALAKAAIEADADSGICGFIWEAPEGCDHLDRDVWRQVMPALGYTVTEERIAGFAASMGELEFRRAFLNQTTPKDGGEDSPVSPEDWERQVDLKSHIEGVAVVGVGMTPDRASTALSVAGRRVGGDFHVDHLKTAPGSSWVLADLLDLGRKWPEIRGVALDPAGPAGSLAGEIDAHPDLVLIKMGARDLGQACGLFADGVRDGRVWHRGQPGLNAAVGRARSRPLGDLWAWVRGNGDDSVVELEAGSLALGAVAGLAEPEDDGPSAVIERGGLFTWD